ncbi:class I SAM-dependent methyltransferase [Candidatus Gottesmanbacteria bacterium]|nr:class I SAM-dependent methyltransferase [Candidatus Gottesmanbacteria bacterium]
MRDDHIKKTIAVYNAMAEKYAKKLNDFAPLPERKKFIALLPNHAHILDVGCGPGRDADYFTANGSSVTGVDFSEKLLEIARLRVPQALFYKQDFRLLHFPKQSFDGIWACASLLHLKRDEVPMVLNNFFQLLKSGGILFIMVKEGKGEADVAEELSSNLSRHFIYFQREELKKLLKNTGFEVVEQYAYNEKDRKPDHRDLWWISSFSRKP